MALLSLSTLFESLGKRFDRISGKAPDSEFLVLIFNTFRFGIFDASTP
ncbi:MAG: hypothetical protein HWE12_15615 [Oceanospirillaceae bacterium]|nr:hypothetical protein [Oceanospirillaceae bacterium]